MTDSPSWPTLEAPILRAIADAERAGEDVWASWQGHLEAELPPTDRRLALVRLAEAGYIKAKINHGDGRVQSVAIEGLTERGLRASGEWPSEDQLGDALIRLIEARIAETEGEERTRWESFLTSAHAVGISGLGGVAARAAGALLGF